MNAVNAKIWAQKQSKREKSLRRFEKNKTVNRSYKLIYFTILIVCVAALAGFAAYSHRNNAPETPLEISGNIINVKAGGNFQAALNQARAGDTIFLQAGAAFKGNFTLPNKTGGEFITIRTSTADAQLPPGGTRIDPKKYASALPKIVSATGEPVISSTEGAHHFRFVGVEIEGNPQGVGNIIKLGTGEEKRAEELPHHIEFDRVFIHGNAERGARRGIAANGRFLKIENSYVSDIKQKGDESQAIAVWATDGQIEIVNNYLEAAAENILFGGAGSNLKLVPTDCVVRDNWLNKPLNWQTEGWEVKNLFEIKNGRRIKVENNLMTNNWGNAQDGTAILFTTRADNDRETVIEDIEFTGNIVRNSPNGINIYGAEGSGGHRLTIRNNLFESIGAPNAGGGLFMKSSAWDGLFIENNTIINSGNIANAYDAPVKNFVFRNNIISENEYGFKGDSTASDKPTIDKFFPGGDVSFNAIIGGNASNYRGKNLFPNSARQVGFINFEEKDYRLRPDSPLRAKGFGGKQIGADLDPKTVGGH